MKLKTAGYVIIVVLIVIAAYFFLSNTKSSANPALENSTAVQDARQLYALLSDGSVDVVGVTEESGLLRVLMRVRTQASDQLQEIFVTKDGRFITDKMLDTKDYRVRLENEKGFATCLQQSGLRVFGVPGDVNTQAQLLVLGQFSSRVFIDCSGANLQACRQLGVENVPTIFFNNTLIEGLRDITFFESATGCRLAR